MEDLHVVASLKDYDTCFHANDFAHALETVQELVAIPGLETDWIEQGHCLLHLGRHEEAVISLNKAIE
jgi:hypothetical protein